MHCIALALRSKETPFSLSKTQFYFLAKWKVELTGKGEGGEQERRRTLSKSLGGFDHYCHGKVLYLDTQFPKLNVKYDPALEMWSEAAMEGVLTAPLPSQHWPSNQPLKLWQSKLSSRPINAEKSWSRERTARCVNFIKPFKAQSLCFLTMLQPTRQLRNHVHPNFKMSRVDFHSTSVRSSEAPTVRE